MYNRLIKAIELAVEAHAEEIDKSGKPGIFHPMAVMLDPELETEDEWILSIMHDVEENFPDFIKWLEIVDLFGMEVAEAFRAITHPHGEPNVAYWARVRANSLALRVKLADIRHNTSRLRLHKLDDATQERLTKKYERAMVALT